MKLIKNMIFKRIVIYLCCSVLIFSSVFMTYTIPVHAEVTYGDLLEDAVYIAFAAAGIWATAQSGGSIVPLLIPYFEILAGTGFDVHDYVTQDEEAGTTTISADFVNLVLQAYKEYKEDNAEKFDGVMNPGTDGYYHYDSLSIKVDYGNSSFSPCLFTYTNINTRYPCALISYSGVLLTDDAYSGEYTLLNDMVFYDKVADEFYFYSAHPRMIPASEKQYLNDFGQTISSLYITSPHLTQKSDDGSFYENDTKSVCIDSTSGYSGAFVIASSSSVPVYHSLAALKEGLRTCDFSAAYNYGKPASSGESSSYTGEYNGGDITVLTEKLSGINDKLKEIDDTGKSIDEKLKELLDWLLKNGGTGGGADLTATNNWLEKIYLKVTQIYDKMDSAVEDAGQAALTKIQESLDEIIEQLKKIKRWTAVDTVIDGADAVADWLDLIRGVLKDAKEGAGSAVTALSSAVGDSVDLMAKKFPFSIPWDILFFVSALSAEPQVPQFEIPFNFEISALDISVDYTMELDFTHLQWLSDLSRLLLSMTYAVGLMKMTFGVTSVGKEE